MTVLELYERLNERIPRALSCEWDNDGLMCCPTPEKEVRRVLVALDVTAAVVDEAIAGGYDLIVSHHPLVFRPLRAIEPSDPVAKKCIRLLLAGISVMSFHTRLDAVEGGVNDTLAAALGLNKVAPFVGDDGCAIGRVGELESPISLEDFAANVKRVTGAGAVSYTDAGRKVFRVALLGGSGSDEVRAAERTGADTYLSGEIAHHHMTDAPERGMNLVAAGHYDTEQPVTRRLRELLLDCDATLDVHVTESNPIKTI